MSNIKNIIKLKKDIELKIKRSGSSASDILENLFTHNLSEEHGLKEKFPVMYDEKGRLKFTKTNRRTDKSFCPFHDGQEHGDAFAIFNNDKTYFCFNGQCDFSGKPMGPVELVMATYLDVDYSRIFDAKLSGKEYLEAGKILSEIMGPELGIKKGDFFIKEKRDPIKLIYEEAARYYHYLGTKNEFYNSKLKEFISGRSLDKGIYSSDELIEKFRLGITPFKSDSLYQFLAKKHKDEDILKTKLCIDRNGKIVDFFRSRAIVPYINNGEVVGFYGRDTNKDGDKRFRHMRLEGEVSMPNGMSEILGSEEFNLSEGEFSNIAIKAMGFEPSMETRGTNGFRDEHIEMIQKVRERNPKKCQTCYFTFDPDDAGNNSVEKLGEKLVDIGVEVKVVRLPEGLDPNDLLVKFGNEASQIFKKLLNEAISYDSFVLINRIKRESTNNLSELRMFFKRNESIMENISKLERAIIVEEVLLNIKLDFDKNKLRQFMFDYWVN